MIDSLTSYVRKDVFPRYHRIIFTAHPWISAVISLLVTAEYVPIAKSLKFFDVSSALLTYNTVVIGFCVSAMAICFTFSKRFSAILCKMKDEQSGFSSYQDLIFVFSWTALSHMAASFLIVIYYFVFSNFEFRDLIQKGFSFYIFSLLTIQIYCFLQFFVTVITVHQVANVYAVTSSTE